MNIFGYAIILIYNSYKFAYPVHHKTPAKALLKISIDWQYTNILTYIIYAYKLRLAIRQNT